MQPEQAVRDTINRVCACLEEMGLLYEMHDGAPYLCLPADTNWDEINVRLTRLVSLVNGATFGLGFLGSCVDGPAIQRLGGLLPPQCGFHSSGTGFLNDGRLYGVLVFEPGRVQVKAPTTTKQQQQQQEGPLYYANVEKVSDWGRGDKVGVHAGVPGFTMCLITLVDQWGSHIIYARTTPVSGMGLFRRLVDKPKYFEWLRLCDDYAATKYEPVPWYPPKKESNKEEESMAVDRDDDDDDRKKNKKNKNKTATIRLATCQSKQDPAGHVYERISADHYMCYCCGGIINIWQQVHELSYKK
jgi:hypothetical protein